MTNVESVVNGVTIHSMQHSEIDREKGLLISHDQYTIFKDRCEPEMHTNSFSLQIYTAEELQAILSENEFEIVGQYDMDGNCFIADKSLNILTVARKKKHVKC
ncbi:MAG: hypothetical protein HKM04_09150 [Legionellales bacterium]|nr:hypothetical protein [Legionellales bacterium]